MEFNRNHYFLLGTVLLFVGLQFRMVDSYLLTEEASKVVTKVWKKAKAESAAAPARPPSIFLSSPPAIVIPRQHKIKPPDWIGWALVSIGAVLILHSLAMKRPG